MPIAPTTLLAVVLVLLLFFGTGGLYYRPSAGNWAFGPLALFLVLLLLLVLSGRVRF
jgi:Sec-independent protein translocase protein TatA